MTAFPSLAAAPLAGAAKVFFIDDDGSAADLVVFPFSFDLGDPGEYEYIFLGIGYRDSGNDTTINGVQVAGNPAEQRHEVMNASGNITRCDIWSLQYGDGGEQDVVVTMSEATLRLDVIVWGVPKGLKSQVPTDVGGSVLEDPSTDDLDVMKDGFALVAAYSSDSTTATPIGVDQDASFVVGGQTMWGGSKNFAEKQTALTVGCDFGGATNATMAAAAFR